MSDRARWRSPAKLEGRITEAEVARSQCRKELQRAIDAGEDTRALSAKIGRLDREISQLYLRREAADDKIQEGGAGRTSEETS